MALPNHDLTPAELDELLRAVLPDIPGYRVLRLLGRGGMSYVYLGIQEPLDRQVAIKVISPLAQEDEVGMQRFEKEARIIAKLQHPGIVGIHAVGRTDMGLLYYVMPYLSRGHLGKRDLRNDEVRIIGVLRALLVALDYAHAQGVVHRDVKPANVLFDHNNRPLLTDFGIAISKRDHSRMTGHGNAVGSWGYMAPEQARGEQVDGRADLYSVGVLTYEMLCGQLPFHDEDSMALALMHALDPVPRLPEHKAHWQGLIDRAMAKMPEQRYASARDMLAALDHIALAPRQRARPASPAPSRSRSASAPGEAARPRLALIATGMALLLALVLAFILWPDATQAPPPPAAPAVAVAAAPLPTPTPVAAAEPVTAREIEETGLVDLDAAATSEAPGEDIFEIPSTLPPGEAMLLAAEEQIRRRRLTQPRGDSALDFLLHAQRELGKDARLAAMGERWLGAVQPYVVAALERGEDDTAIALLDGAGRLDQALSFGASAAWRELHDAIVAPVHLQLRQALADKDLAALRAAKQRAVRLGIPAAQLEPDYSRPIITAGVGDALRSGATTMVLVRMPGDAQPGLAVLPTVVTQREYAGFANASGRAASPCRNRAALVSLKNRSWKDPGFIQTGEHPVVCVSVPDAQAYAAWLSQRDGVKYRLPSAAEWRGATGAPAQAACGFGGVLCQDGGTAPAQQGPRHSNGVYGLLGNVREWPAGCTDCRDHPTLGVGWRDGSGARKDGEVNPVRGYDDIGFRLVRDVARESVEQR